MWESLCVQEIESGSNCGSNQTRHCCPVRSQNWGAKQGKEVLAQDGQANACFSQWPLGQSQQIKGGKHGCLHRLKAQRCQAYACYQVPLHSCQAVKCRSGLTCRTQACQSHLNRLSLTLPLPNTQIVIQRLRWAYWSRYHERKRKQ